MSRRPPPARRQDLVEHLHGVPVADPYRWLEDSDSDDVSAWDNAHRAAFTDHADSIEQVAWLDARLKALWRYDDESSPRPCLYGEREFVHRRLAQQDKWVAFLREGADGELQKVLDPNTWDKHDTLSGFFPSPDGRYVAYGRAHAGDENPVLRVIDTHTMQEMPDVMRGWRQGGVVWRHDAPGFYFSARPIPGSVPDGQEFYSHRVWYHRLGTSADDDELVLFDDEVREHFHGVEVSENGRWLLLGRYRFNTSQLWLAPVDDPSNRAVVCDAMDAEYDPTIVNDTLLIRTDWQAPGYRLMVTSVDKPGREHWRELVAESESILIAVHGIGGHLYLRYQHNACTRVAVYTLDGVHLHDIAWPGLGTASVSGHWSRSRVLADYASFAHPREVFSYDRDANELTLLRPSPLQIDVSDIEVRQVWYTSADGTRVSMFVVGQSDALNDGSTPFLLTGYGGFNISRTPVFSSLYALWTSCGGGVAIANLRGGGEYGRSWHCAGMREHKQNVFDDFIAAAEYLDAQGYTRPERLAIAGGSNGGLLVSAVMSQRPELFCAVLCAVPLTDMVRFPRFGIASIWTEEYGDPEDAEQFQVLFNYSPYHNIVEGPSYPSLLVTGSLNDARTDPVHARKFFAVVDHAARPSDARWLHIQSASGHHGAVTIDDQARQVAMHYGFLMSECGLQTPSHP